MQLFLLVEVYRHFTEGPAVIDRAGLVSAELTSPDPYKMAKAIIDRFAIPSKISVTVAPIDPRVDHAFQKMWDELDLIPGVTYQFRPVSFQIIGAPPVPAPERHIP